MSDSNKKELARSLSASDLTQLLKAMRLDGSPENARLVRAAIDQLISPTIHDIWHDEGVAISHWVLLLNGINSSEEHRLASELCLWRGCFAGPDARVRCIQSSERAIFAFTSKMFSVTAPPALLVGDDPLFTRYLKIDGGLLSRLTEHENGLHRFLTKVHTALLHGQSIEDLATQLATEQFWRAMKILYAETKGLFSIQIKAP